MSEWKAIPSYKDYTMSTEGDICDSEGNYVNQYMGRASFTEEKHARVRLRNQDGLPIANSVEELLYETFPHLIPKPEEPEQVAEIVKPRKPKRVRKPRPKRSAGRAKPFEDDLGPEWAMIPGFLRYKINREGQLINRRTKSLVKLRYSSKGSPNYSLLDDTGETKARHPETLLGLAFRDLAAARKIRKSAVMHPPGEWRPIPNRTAYEIHASGEVRRISRHRPQVFEDDNGYPYVKLKTDGVKGFKNYYISGLVREVYGEQKAAA